MTTAATSLLGLALPVTGELQGTWGTTVNDSITSLLDTAIAGTTTLSTDGDVTLSTTTLAANQARQAILLCSGARTALRTITAPAQSKIYTIINATTGGFSVKLVGVGPTTGLTIPNGASAVVAWNGSDFIEIGSSTVGNLTVNGNLTVTGTTTLSGGTANGVAYLNGSKVVTTGTALTFDGSIFGVSGAGTIYGSVTNTQVGGSARLRLFNTGDTSDGFAIINNEGASGQINLLNYKNSPIAFWVNSSEQMRLTSTGLGIGTSSPGVKLDVQGGSINTSSFVTITPTTTTLNAIYRATNAGGTFFAGLDNSSGGVTGTAYTAMLWHTGAYPISFGTNNTLRATLDPSGNLGLGVTPSAWSTLKGFDISSGGALFGYTAQVGLANNAYFDGSSWRYKNTDLAMFFRANALGFEWHTAPSGTAGNAISFTQAMTLDASGNLLVGTTTSLGKLTVEQNLGGVGDAIGLKDTGSSYGSGAVYINFKNNAGSVAGKIEHTASTTVNYNTSSDARLKTDIGVATDTSVIDQIVIHDFEWKEDGRIDRGVFAQEAHEIKPSAVSVGSDETNEDGVLLNPWGVDYSKFVPDLIVHAKQLKKTVQEQQTLITQLTERITALEAK